MPSLLSQFKKEMNVAVLVVLHLSKRSIGQLLVTRMQKHASFTCKIPKHGEQIKPQHIYFCQPDHHMLVKDEKILLGRGPVENRYRPSIDALFRSAAAYYDSSCIGIVLTGMLEDGASGMLAIKRSGGFCIVQDPDEAKYPDMPNAVIQLLKPDFTLPISKMGETVSLIIEKPKRKKVRIPQDIKQEAEIAERINLGDFSLKPFGNPSFASCPDCGGKLFEMDENGTTRYRCHIGHAYSEAGLLTGMEVTMESALWTALRILEERKNILGKIQAREKLNKNRTAALSYEKRIAELEAQTSLIKEVLFNGASPDSYG